MAAADYYNPSGGGTGSPVPTRQYPVQAAHPSQQHLNPPYPISDAPPPYTEYAQSPGPSQQPPPLRRNDDYNRPPPRPQQSFSSSSQYPPEKPSSSSSSRPIPNNFNEPYNNSNSYNQQPPPPPAGTYPIQAASASRPGPAPSKLGYLQPPTSAADPYRRPASTPAAPPKGILKNKHEQSPYRHRSRSRSRSSSRERRRSRSRHRHHNRQSYQQPLPSSSSSSQLRPGEKKPHSNNLKTFLGAGGGAIIGDAIFPGLGTLGGAILGGLSGHEYGKRRDADDRNTTRYVLADNKARTRSYSNNDEDGYGHYRDERRGRRY